MITRHSIGHVEWACTDFKRTVKFYRSLFGWEFRPFGNNYMLFKAPGCTSGGFIRVSRPALVGPGFSPLVYVEVDAIDPYLKKVRSVGGRVSTPKTQIPGTGSFAHLRDPDGNLVVLYEEKRR